MASTSESTPSPEAKSGSNKLVVVLVIVIVFLAALGFAAQKLMQKASVMVGQKVGEKVAEGIIEKATGGKADVDVKSGNVTVKTSEGSFSTGTNLPDDWPKDVPVYPGSTVTYSGSNTTKYGDSGIGAVLSTKDTTQKVRDYYAKELVVQGWLVESTYNADETSVLSATKDTRTVAVSIGQSDDMTTITLGVSQKSQQ